MLARVVTVLATVAALLATTALPAAADSVVWNGATENDQLLCDPLDDGGFCIGRRASPGPDGKCPEQTGLIDIPFLRHEWDRIETANGIVCVEPVSGGYVPVSPGSVAGALTTAGRSIPALAESTGAGLAKLKNINWSSGLRWVWSAASNGLRLAGGLFNSADEVTESADYDQGAPDAMPQITGTVQYVPDYDPLTAFSGDFVPTYGLIAQFGAVVARPMGVVTVGALGVNSVDLTFDYEVAIAPTPPYSTSVTTTVKVMCLDQTDHSLSNYQFITNGALESPKTYGVGSTCSPAGVDYLHGTGTGSGSEEWVLDLTESRPLRPVQQTLEVRYKCGTTNKTATVTYGDDLAGGAIAFPDLPCEGGENVGDVSLWVSNDGAPAEHVWTLADPAEEAVGQIGAELPAVLGLTVETLNGTVSCFDQPEECADWPIWDASEKLKLQCSWDGDPVDLGHCLSLGGLFTTGKGLVYGDPETGGLPLPKDAPEGDGEPTPGGGGFPTEGENPVNEDAGNCMDQFWSWNPIDWVFVPVKCALVWAFVPDAEALEGAVAPFVNGYNSSSVKTWLDAATGSVSGVSADGLGGCTPWTVNYPMATGGDENITILNPCTGPVATAASVSRVVSTVVLVVLGGWAVVRVLLGAGFGVRVGVAEQEGEKV